MKREALRDVLKELKGHLRGRRGAEYLKKKEEKDEEPKGDKDKSLAEEFIDGAKSDPAHAEKPKDEDKDEGPDFADEIKNFMKKKRVSESSKGGPSKRVVTFEVASIKQEKGKEAGKGKPKNPELAGRISPPKKPNGEVK